AEVRRDVDGLRQHVDTYASTREQRAFELERKALLAEITHEADHFSGLYEAKAAAVKSAADGFREALALVADCEQELAGLARTIEAMPAGAVAGAPAPVASPAKPQAAVAGAVSPEPVAPRGCCFCFRRRGGP
ncbi:hypothetical protein TSOC_002883, partial [Tetrabaena socialis]